MTAHDSDWNGICDIAKLNKAKKASLLQVQSALEQGRQELVSRVHEFLQARNNLVETAARVGSQAERCGLGTFSSRKALDILLWVHSVRFSPSYGL